MERVPVVYNSLGGWSAGILGRYEAIIYVFDLDEDIQDSDRGLERCSLEKPLRFLQDLFYAVPRYEFTSRC